MIIYDNIIFSLQKAGGISIVWENLIRGVKDLITAEFIEYQHASENINRKTLDLSDDKIILRKSPSLLLEQFLKPKVGAPDDSRFIFHSSYYRTSGDKRAINVTTVHDFIYEIAHPKLAFSQKIRCALNHKAIRNSDYIVCISENTKADLLRIIPDVKDKPIYVIHNGVSSDYRPIPEYIGAMPGTFLYVGGRQSYKNFDFAVEMSVRAGKTLMICGKDINDEERRLLEHRLGRNKYKVICHPSNSELNILYNSVDALIYPSSYEGFGIPILEAQRAGCPVIAFKSSSIPEIIGETPLLLDSFDHKNLDKALKILNSESVRQEIIEAGLKNSSRFSWDKMAVDYLELYNKILK